MAIEDLDEALDCIQRCGEVGIPIANEFTARVFRQGAKNTRAHRLSLALILFATQNEHLVLMTLADLVENRCSAVLTSVVNKDDAYGRFAGEPGAKGSDIQPFGFVVTGDDNASALL